MAILIEHPCVQHKLAIVRDAGTGHKRFRELSKEITQFICYEALKNVKTKEVEVETPVATATCRKIDTDLVVVPILRAGVGMLDGILELVPTARVGFIGLYRDEETKQILTAENTKISSCLNMIRAQLLEQGKIKNIPHYNPRYFTIWSREVA